MFGRSVGCTTFGAMRTIQFCDPADVDQSSQQCNSFSCVLTLGRTQCTYVCAYVMSAMSELCVLQVMQKLGSLVEDLL